MNEQDLRTILKREFGFSDFRPGQLATIEALLTGHHALAILPTGSGKTLIYQLVGRISPGVVVIISPLLSLMQDQLNRLRIAGETRVAMVSSLLDFRERRTVLAHLGDYHYVFFSPEMITSQEVLAALTRCQISLMVVDEAHCISEWGPDFRPHYLLLKQVLDKLGQPRTLMLTATATSRLAGDIISKLGLSPQQVTVIRQSVDRPNIFLAVDQVSSEVEKRQQLTQLVSRYGGRGIIYFSSRKVATETANWLSTETGIIAAPYHAGIDTLNRYRIQQQFMNDQLQVICATSAFGMGIDKDDVRYVIHYHLPKSLAAYVQEIGRAGRNGEQSLAVLLYAPGDEQLPLTLSQLELPADEQMREYQSGNLKAEQLGESAEIIAFYLDHGWHPGQLRDLFKRRWQLSKKQVAEMVMYASANTCKRQIIAKHFGERLDNQPTLCCSIDQVDWRQRLKLPPAMKQSSSATRALNWRQRLATLFNSTGKLGDRLDS